MTLYLRPAISGLVLSFALLACAGKPAATAPGAVASRVLAEGTEIRILAPTGPSADSSRTGDTLTLRVAEAVVLDGEQVIAEGAPVWATVVGRLMVARKPVIRLDSTSTTGGQVVRLRNTRRASQTSTVESPVVDLALSGLLGSLGSGDIAAGATLRGYVAQQVILASPADSTA